MRPPPWLGRVARAGFLVLAVGLLLGYLWSEREGAAEAVRDIGPGYALASLAAVLVGLLASMSVWRALLADLGAELSLRAAFHVLPLATTPAARPFSTSTSLTAAPSTISTPASRHALAIACVIDPIPPIACIHACHAATRGR